MFLGTFAKDIRDYSLKVLNSSKNNIGESIQIYEEPVIISGILVQLRSPKEIGDTFMKQISEHALYTTLEFSSSRGDKIFSGELEYEVITCQTVQYFAQDDPFRIHYLKLIQ